MKAKIFLLCSCLFMIAGAVKSQSQDSRVLFGLNYNYSFPINSFRSDMFGSSSPRGFSGELGYQINPALSAGLGFGYQDYYSKIGRQVYDVGNSQHVSAVVSNSMQIVPLLARVEWLPFSGGMKVVEPYISLGAGINVVSYSQYLGQFPSSATKAGFRLQGGLGVKVPVIQSKGWGVDVGGTYDYAPFKQFGLKNLNNINVHGGVYVTL